MKLQGTKSMISNINNIVNQQDIPQTPWKSERMTNNILNQHKVPETQWKSGDAEETEEETGFWIRGSDLDSL
jgi:hypothetical protein